jgi:DNA polymerase III epsilon subunit family exonuclease
MQGREVEYIEKIRKSAGLKNAILIGIEVSESRKIAEFCLVTDLPHTKEEEEAVNEWSNHFIPKGWEAKVRIVKRVPDEEILRDRIYDFMQKNFPVAAAFFQREDIHVQLLESGATFSFDIASGEQGLFSSANILDEVSRYLQSGYCGSFFGNVRIVEKEREEVSLDMEEKEEVNSVKARYFPIENYEKIDGADEVPTLATYIEDAIGEGEYVLCGRVNFLQERVSKKGKTYFTFTLQDGSGSIRVSYFPKKGTMEQIQGLKQGESIVCIGSNELFNGNLSYTAKKINLGNPPKDYEYERKESKPVPSRYKAVFPEPYSDYTQTGLFDREEKPQDLKDKTFVVFDLETTGTNHNPATGKVDRIIEIGGVKMVGGEVVEKFSSFVACPEKIPPNIVELTGIHDEDLVGAPTIEEVIPDFFKFVSGCALVGHNNIGFDGKFIRYYGKELGYYFDNVEYDTLPLSQELLRGEVNNFKLNTIADYYGFSFNHHRAYEDALTTAKCFVELIKKRKGLPY